ncbi:hypothetical protein M9194_13950 [Vibrio sp. S4M6]|uniref:hypothetical protein n=1 Tax=Vibrio sinus TaxID=2946865 RepID=UPI00202A10D2|nr:hypothetical protein [Vibrio sinus]MCL9782534.1 hypothetical protein [Vibrio sinus]
MKRILFLVLIVASTVSSLAYAGTYTTSGNIGQIRAYADSGSSSDTSDVVILLNTGLSQCPTGVWLSATSPGLKSMLSVALTAYAANKPVVFQVSNTMWPGNNNPYCQVVAAFLGQS